MAWTTTELISEVRRRLRLPSGADSGGVLDSDIIASGNRSYLSQMLPFLRSMMEGYGQIEVDVTVVADQSDYTVPANLLGGTFDDLLLVDNAGNERNVEHIPPTLAHVYRAPGRWAYSMIGGQVRLSPTPTTAIGTLRFKGVDRAKLVAASAGTTVASVTSTGAPSEITVADATALASVPYGISVDVRSASSPFRIFRLSAQAGVTTAPTMTIGDSTGPDTALSGIAELEVGDWITLPGESVVIPIPDVLHYALASHVTQSIAMELGQAEIAGREGQAFGQEMQAARSALSPRARGERRPIVNLHSPSRARRRFRK